MEVNKTKCHSELVLESHNPSNKKLNFRHTTLDIRSKIVNNIGVGRSS